MSLSCHTRASQFSIQLCQTALSRLSWATHDGKIWGPLQNSIRRQNWWISLKNFLAYSGSITTPDGATVIVLDYDWQTWRLPKVGSISWSTPTSDCHMIPPSHNIFSNLEPVLHVNDDTYVPDLFSNERTCQFVTVVCNSVSSSEVLHTPAEVDGHEGTGTLYNRLQSLDDIHYSTVRYTSPSPQIRGARI